MSAQRPGPDEHAPYYSRYIALVPDGDIVDTLAAQWPDSARLLGGLGEERERSRYAPGKWSVRESVSHLVDTERVFTGRVLWFARGATDALPGMDQDAWVPASGADDRAVVEHLAEWAAVRTGLVSLLRGLPEAAWSARGVASGVEVSVRALAWMVAGHELHHRTVWRDAYGIEGR
jgi:hypothetical protein